MLDQDKILNFLRTTGPTLPSKVAKNIGTDILFASAHLSFLVSQGKVRISKLKIGGSPLYYLPGQEDQLYPFAAGNVNPKELQVLDRLKEEKVLREANLDLLSKVALRSLKDFSVPLHVTINGKRELFWRWYILPPDETKEEIGRVLKEDLPLEKMQDAVSNDNGQMKNVIPPVQVQVENDKMVTTNEGISNEKLSDLPINSKKSEVIQKKIDKKIENELVEVKKIKQKIKDITDVKGNINEELMKENVVQDLTNEVTTGVTTGVTNEVTNDTILKKVNKDNLIVNDQKNVNKVVGTKLKKVEKSVSMDTEKVKKVKVQELFFPEVDNFLKTLEITIKRKETVRKNSEINLHVNVKSVVGEMEYFCKAKKKHRVDEKDVSAAYMEAQIHKLPLLFLYTNQITKKAEDILKNEVFSNAVIKKINL